MEKNNFKIEAMDQHAMKRNCMLICLYKCLINVTLNAIFFSAQDFDILRLIQEVKKHPILYAKDMKASKESREEAWLKISYTLETPRKLEGKSVSHHSVRLGTESVTTLAFKIKINFRKIC